jgi:hypothetical protein
MLVACAASFRSGSTVVIEELQTYAADKDKAEGAGHNGMLCGLKVPVSV